MINDPLFANGFEHIYIYIKNIDLYKNIYIYAILLYINIYHLNG